MNDEGIEFYNRVINETIRKGEILNPFLLGIQNNAYKFYIRQHFQNGYIK